MALSIDSIFKPINDFFLNLYKTDAESPLFFRFNKFGSIISDGDFMGPLNFIPVDVDPHNPQSGYSPSLAREKFSELVNFIPVEDADGQNIYMTTNAIDTTYRDLLLGPAIPFIADGQDEETKNSIQDSFNHIKAEAIKLWEDIKLESSTGLMFQFKPALATPENWYDKTNDDIWTPYNFHVEEPVTPAPADNSSKFQLWKLKIEDDLLKKVFPVNSAQLSEPLQLSKSVLMMKSTPIINQNLVIGTTESIKETPAVNEGVLMNRNVALEKKAPLINESRIFNKEVIVKATPLRTEEIKNFIEPVKTVTPKISVAENVPIKSFNIQNSFQKNSALINISDRLAVNQFLDQNAPTQPVKTDNFTMSFKYCLVNINRPWYYSSFITDKTWFIPNTTKGQLSAKDNTGGNITVLPIAFITIKNLVIEANWASEDIAAAKIAKRFGPFEVDSEIINNKISHEGIQIIGWLLQRVPDLPPN